MEHIEPGLTSEVGQLLILIGGRVAFLEVREVEFTSLLLSLIINFYIPLHSFGIAEDQALLEGLNAWV